MEIFRFPRGNTGGYVWTGGGHPAAVGHWAAAPAWGAVPFDAEPDMKCSGSHIDEIGGEWVYLVGGVWIDDAIAAGAVAAVPVAAGSWTPGAPH